MNNLVVPYDIIKELIISGVKFNYLSYSHKLAIGWMNSNILINNLLSSPSSTTMQHSHDYVPDSIRDQFPLWQTGKIWELKFNRISEIVKVYIGKNPKYKKAFYIQDFGVKFKPIIFKSDDKYNLIANGFAVEDEL